MRLREIGNRSVEVYASHIWVKWIEEGANVKSAYLESIGSRTRIEMNITT